MVLVNISHEISDVRQPSVEPGDGSAHLPQLPCAHTPQHLNHPLRQIVNVVQLAERSGVTHIIPLHTQATIDLVNFIGHLTNG